MVEVTSTIKRILAAQHGNETLGAERVLALLAEVQRQIVAELSTAPTGSYSAYYLRGTLDSIERHLAEWQGAAGRELGAGLERSWAAGREVLPAALGAAGMQMVTPYISSHLLDSLKEFTFGRISAVSGDLFNKIKGELTLGMLGQKTPQEIAGELTGLMKDVPIPTYKKPGPRFGHPIFKSVAERAEVITGLEMGRAFSMATELSIEAAQETLPGLKKMWLHAGHPGTPRQVHLLMHGQVRAPGKPFYQAGGVKVMYPRDPGAPISEVIRCGCIHVPYMEAWGSAQEWKRDFDTRQKNLWEEGRRLRA